MNYSILKILYFLTSIIFIEIKFYAGQNTLQGKTYKSYVNVSMTTSITFSIHYVIHSMNDHVLANTFKHL